MDKAWEVLVGSVMWIFKNKPKDRFATRAPFEGSMKDTDVGVVETLTNVLQNAFVEAFEKNVEGSLDFQDADNVEVQKEEGKGFLKKIFSGSEDE